MSPVRIQRQRTKGWRMPEGAAYVGRPSKWGNPFLWTAISRLAVDANGERFVVPQEERRRLVVMDFRSMVMFGIGRGRYPVTEIRSELAGKDLACWCPLDQPCHADVLLELANEDAP